MKLDSCFYRKPWIPAFAGMTKTGQKGLFSNPSRMKKNEEIRFGERN
jgi:hypothetical protein